MSNGTPRQLGQYGVNLGGSSLVYFFEYLHLGHLAVTVTRCFGIAYSLNDIPQELHFTQKCPLIFTLV